MTRTLRVITWETRVEKDRKVNFVHDIFEFDLDDGLTKNGKNFKSYPGKELMKALEYVANGPFHITIEIAD